MGKASRKKNRRAGTIDLEPNAKKASTRLAQLIAPHAEDDETRSSYEALVALGAMAWNLSLVPAQDRDNFTREAVWSAVASGIPLTYAWLNELVERRISLFPSEKRWIQRYEVVLQPDGRFAIVVVTVS